MSGTLDISKLRGAAGASTLSAAARAGGLHDRLRVLDASSADVSEEDVLLVCHPPLAKLRTLRVGSSARLNRLPDTSSLAALSRLAAADCALVADAVGPLPRELHELELSGNVRLRGIPYAVLALRHLRVLHLRSVGLTSLPAGLAALVELSELLLDDNPGLCSLALVGEEGAGTSGAAAEGGTGGWARLERLSSVSARCCGILPEPACLPLDLLRDSPCTLLALSGNPRLSQRALQELPGIAAYAERSERARRKGVTADGIVGGGATAVGGGALCGVER